MHILPLIHSVSLSSRYFPLRFGCRAAISSRFNLALTEEGSYIRVALWRRWLRWSRVLVLPCVFEVGGGGGEEAIILNYPSLSRALWAGSERHRKSSDCVISATRV